MNTRRRFRVFTSITTLALALVVANVRLNLRGAGGTHVHCASLYHVGLGEDLDAVIAWIEHAVLFAGIAGGR